VGDNEVEAGISSGVVVTDLGGVKGAAAGDKFWGKGGVCGRATNGTAEGESIGMDCSAPGVGL